jgi:hypothetical protein
LDQLVRQADADGIAEYPLDLGALRPDVISALGPAGHADRAEEVDSVVHWIGRE